MPARRSPSNHRQHHGCACAESNNAQLNLALKAIEIERDNLSRAESLLRCLKIAMESEGISSKGPYFPDVAEIAQQMVRKSIRALDPINLPDPACEKVKEDFLAIDVPPLLASVHVPLLPKQAVMLPQRYALRIHRRNYSRVAARKVSSRDSASANISG